MCWYMEVVWNVVVVVAAAAAAGIQHHGFENLLFHLDVVVRLCAHHADFHPLDFRQLDAVRALVAHRPFRALCHFCPRDRLSGFHAKSAHRSMPSAAVAEVEAGT